MGKKYFQIYPNKNIIECNSCPPELSPMKHRRVSGCGRRCGCEIRQFLKKLGMGVAGYGD